MDWSPQGVISRFARLRHLRGRRRGEVGSKARAAIRRLVENLKYELIPLKNVLDQAAFLPEGAMVSVTASPTKGMGATIDLSLELAERGFEVIPHLSARLTTGKAELERYLARLDAHGIRRAFVVGGDSDPAGEFVDGLSLLRAIEDLGSGLAEIGVPSYPEGHPSISDDKLALALRQKEPYVSYMTTQMCFTPRTISRWIAAQRQDGVALPVYLGIPGVAELSRLIAISVNIGVGESMRFLSKNTSLVGKLVRPGGYSPDRLIIGLGETLADPVADIRGFHVYTFNRVETTERWRKKFLETLGDDA